MNAQDSAELKRLLHNPAFHEEFSRFIRLVLTDRPPVAVGAFMSARAMRNGTTNQEAITIVNPGQDAAEVLHRISAYWAEARRHAERLARFFPEARRWHWQQVFVNMAMGGSGDVRPCPAGRPHGSGYFQDADEFTAAVRVAVVGISHQGRRPSQETVASFFGNHREYPKCDERQLRRWCEQFGVDWSDLVRESDP